MRRSVGGLALACVVLVALTACVPWGPRPELLGEKPEVAEQPRLITVSGEAEVKVVPDEVVLTLGVETWKKELQAAKERNDAIVQRLFSYAQENDIEPRDLQTDYISIEPRYEDDYERQNFIGFFVRNTVVITLRDPERFNDFLAGVLQTGVTHVHGIEFRTSQLRQHRDQARALAIRAAEEKATALAGELGQRLGEPTSVSEDSAGWYSWYNSWWGYRYGSPMSQNVVQPSGEGVAPEGAVAPGTISVTARVTVTFELE